LLQNVNYAEAEMEVIKIMRGDEEGEVLELVDADLIDRLEREMSGGGGGGGSDNTDGTVGKQKRRKLKDGHEIDGSHKKKNNKKKSHKKKRQVESLAATLEANLEGMLFAPPPTTSTTSTSTVSAPVTAAISAPALLASPAALSSPAPAPALSSSITAVASTPLSSATKAIATTSTAQLARPASLTPSTTTTTTTTTTTDQQGTDDAMNVDTSKASATAESDQAKRALRLHELQQLKTKTEAQIEQTNASIKSNQLVAKSSGRANPVIQVCAIDANQLKQCCRVFD
jgi:hypothetical protein